LAGVPFVGLTGGLGAGKSEALRALADLGAATLSTDAVVHELLAGDELRELVVARLGDGVAPGGELDRSLIADRVFGDDEARAWLEGELWPRVGKRVWDWRQEVGALDPAPRAAVVEVPLLFESGMEGVFDTTVAVTAADGVRRERAEARGHALVGEREARQLAQEEKADRAEHHVANEGSIEDLERELSALVEKLRR
jgi:dephospho-CoA kinase